MKFIQVDTELLVDGRVRKIASKAGISAGRALGGMVYVWILAGIREGELLPGWEFEDLDAELGVPGFSEAAKSVGWLDSMPGGVLVTNYAKQLEHYRRSKDASRKRAQRAGKAGKQAEN